MKVRTGGRTIEIPDERIKVRPEGRSVKEQAHASYGVLAAPSPYAFTLYGKIKSGKNNIQITRTGRRFPKPQFVEWRTAMLAQMPKIEQPFIGPVKMQAMYAPGDLLRRDVPGMVDGIFHLLEKHGVVLDDAQVQEVHWIQTGLDRENPHCYVHITRLQP